MTLKQTLRAIGNVVLEEAERNADFARRLEGVLGLGDVQQIVKRSRTRAPAVLDPIGTLADRGEDVLRDELRALNLEQLLDIVAEFGMDSSKLAMKWKSSDRVTEHIVDHAKRRSVKGDAFRA